MQRGMGRSGLVPLLIIVIRRDEQRTDVEITSYRVHFWAPSIWLPSVFGVQPRPSLAPNYKGLFPLLSRPITEPLVANPEPKKPHTV